MANEEWVTVRLRVQDRNRFIGDMKAAGYATRGLGKEVEGTGRLLTTGAHHGFLWNQMLFTLRRATFYATLGVAALGAGAVAAGLQFDNMMEQQQLAFKYFTGSAALARKEVDWLFNLAAHGPFTFPQVIQASRQLMAFGFTTQYANKTLTALQDAMSAMGLDQSGLDRATLALGQISSSGRLLGQDLRQLEQLGLVNLEDLAKRLNVNPAKLASQTGTLGIPSKVAIDAIMAYWQTRYKGAADAFAKTFQGRWSTLTDYARKLFGGMAQPLFNYLRDQVFPEASKIAQAMQEGFDQKQGGGWIGALGALDKLEGTNTVGIFNALTFAGTQWWIALREIYTAFFAAVGMFKIGSRALYILGAALWGVAHILEVLNYDIPVLGSLLKWLIALWIVDRTVVIAAMLATKSKVAWDAIETAWTKRKIFWTKLGTAARGRDTLSIWANIAALRAWAFAEEAAVVGSGRWYTGVFKNNGMIARFTRSIWTKAIPSIAAYVAATQIAAASTWAWTIALLSNPITWIVIGVLALVGGLVVLYFRWQRFHNAVDQTWRFIMTNAPYVAAAITLAFGPLGAVIASLLLIVRYWEQIKGVINAIVNPFDKIKGPSGLDLWDHVPGVVKKVIGWSPLAEGGPVGTAGWHVVGERGPELVRIPGGSHVFSHDDVVRMGVPAAGAAGGGFDPRTRLQTVIQLMLNDKVLAEAVAESTLDSIGHH